MSEAFIQHIIRSKRKTLALQIAPDARLIVRAPERVSMGTIEKLVRKQLPWIHDKQRLARETFVLPVHKEFVDGESFLFLGERYTLCLSDAADAPLSLTGTAFLLHRQYLPEARERFVSWYRQQALETLAQRVTLYGEQAGLKHRRMHITNASKRWGSCSSTGVLNFSWRLIMAPLQVVDYVVVHELVHIAEPHHAKAFWDRVSMIVPQYQQAKAWLRQHHHQLDI